MMCDQFFVHFKLLCEKPIYEKKQITYRNVKYTDKETLKSKVTILNNLALSPLIYVSSVIDTPDIVIKEVDKIIIEFVWKGKMHKIAKNVIIQTIGDGGLKFPDFK